MLSTVRRRFNFKKANWNAFSTDLDTSICDIDPSPENYDRFVKVVHATARKYIPGGCRNNYVPGRTTDLAEQYNEYIQLYEQEPFSADTITAGNELAQALTVEQRKMWQALIENTDMTHNSKKAWPLIKKLSNDPRKADQHVNVTPNQVAHQLILNGKVPNRQRQSKIKRCGKENHDFDDDFTIVELQNSLKHLKNRKAAGLDEILTEETNNVGPVTTQWVVSLLNACARTHRLPRLWRQARVVALLRPGPSSPKSFRPISLLCHLYTLYERLILNRLSPAIQHVLISEQAGFRPGKSCTAQALNLTQHIEDGFETGKITGIVLVDLSAAYDTVNHRRLLEKVYNMTRDYRLICMIRTLLENRRFFVELGGKRSRWRSQLLRKISQERKKCIIMADFNIDLLTTDTNHQTADFIHNMFTHMFCPTISKPTRVTNYSATLIDNIITNIHEYPIKSGILYNEISDHFPIFNIYKLGWQNTKK